MTNKYMSSSSTLKEFLPLAFAKGMYSNDDIIAFIAGAIKEMIVLHENNLVLPTIKDEVYLVVDNALTIDDNLAIEPKINRNAVENWSHFFHHKSFQKLTERKVEIDLDSGSMQQEMENVYIGEVSKLERPAYIMGYHSFEIYENHHDAVTDIFSLGLVLASVAYGLNFYNENDVRNFVQIRENAYYFNTEVHPTIASVIVGMTELNRNKRIQDLNEVYEKLINYREYNIEKTIDLSQIAGWRNQVKEHKRQFILSKLRNRLFDFSKRNRLLYYKQNARFLNLTICSVPNVVYFESIRPELLFTWHNEIATKVISGREIVLNKYVRLDDHKYIPATLDKIRVESQRDNNEFGFSQLKLVITMLNWYNFKENAEEPIQSPLLLLPVVLRKTKNVKEDLYTIKSLTSEAEVNPVVANYLKDLYSITLPDYVDLEQMSVEEFYTLVNKQITDANHGISLTLVDQPRVKIIHTIAKQTIQNFKRKQKITKAAQSSYKNIEYSYEQNYFKPLGLEIYKSRVKPLASYLDYLLNEDIKIDVQNLVGDKERTHFELVERNSNPYNWEFDMCNVILGNFNYKKMSLVRDYNTIIENNTEHLVFEELFGTENKSYTHYDKVPTSVLDWHHVITADATQTDAVLFARTKKNYIIQGPPGTGKSQTITNLIADFLAQKKTVLFVCEKRAALDVVFYRLKQCGLEGLCSYIHDSQSDKRSFVMDVKNRYEIFKKQLKIDKQNETKRKILLNELESELKVLEQYHLKGNELIAKDSISCRGLLDKMLGLPQVQKPKLTANLPHFADWHRHEIYIKNLSREVEKSIGEVSFAMHPANYINAELFSHDDFINTVQTLVLKIRNCHSIILDVILKNGTDITLHVLSKLLSAAIELQPVYRADSMNVLNGNTQLYQKFDELLLEKQKLQNETTKQKNENKNWVNKFSKADAIQALEIAREKEGSFFKFLSSTWKQVESKLKVAYNFSTHQIKPKISIVLSNLLKEIELQELLDEKARIIRSSFVFIDESFTTDSLLELRKKISSTNYKTLVENPNLLNCILENSEELLQFRNSCSQLLRKPEDEILISEVEDICSTIEFNLDSMNEMKVVLKKFNELPKILQNYLHESQLSPLEMESQICANSFLQICETDAQFNNTDYLIINAAITNINSILNALLNVNAAYINEGLNNEFLQTIELTQKAASQLTPQQKELKKIYIEARKILENEFTKSVRYKSIRELVEKESGQLLKLIKPIWLMSPLSVSDSLPLDEDLFDVVIFDEASQITLEEGVPALFRSKQVIIVGDDKQMPPTNFFSSKAEDPDDVVKHFADEEYVLQDDTDSILIQGARKLTNTMLCWHYRSYYETLISYSNHAFYKANLFTIPDKVEHHEEKSRIEIHEPKDAENNVFSLYDRSISFHHFSKAVYESRTNVQEANYIAQLVRKLLLSNAKESIGIVAFSQEQQHAIEDALSSLAAGDSLFEKLLEEAYDRYEDDQYVGLIVKNLENIQGDERDIIILSICYGPDSNGRMIMNFGPINKKGGEKRLNVIFSRAKKHIAVISTIRHHQITNEYNEGANYLKCYLQYAENVSNGNMEMAKLVLENLLVKERAESKSETDIVTNQIAKSLTQKGYAVTLNIGQSSFKCSLAVKENANDKNYTLAILVDDQSHYSNSNVIEQYVQRKSILKAMGWRVVQVMAKDWWQHKSKILELIENNLKNDEEEKIYEFRIIESEISDPKIVSIEMNEPAENTIEKGSTFYLQNTQDGHNKFWQIAIHEDVKLMVKFGKIGTKGQVQIKSFETNEKAQHEMEKLIAEKLKKGYVVTTE